MRKIFIPFFIFVILVGVVSANLSVEVLNENLNKGETFVGVIDADLVYNLDVGDIKVIQDRRNIPLEKGIFRYDNLTFFYIIFSREGKFTIESNEHLLYRENGSLVSEFLNLSVEIGNSGDEVLSIKPGILVGKTPSLMISNIGKNSLDVSVQNEKIELGINDIKRVNISPPSGLSYIDVKSYKTFKIPIIFSPDIEEDPVKNISEEDNDSLSSNEVNESIIPFELEIDFLEEIVTANETSFFNISILNKLNETIELNIGSSSEKLFFNDTISLLPYEEVSFNFEFFSEYGANFEGEIIFNFNDFKSFLNLSFLVFSDEEEFDSIIGGYENLESCLDVGCVPLSGQTCKGGSVGFVGSDFCCVGGTCVSPKEEKEKSNSINYVIGFLALVAAGALGYFFYKKYSGAKVKPKF